MARQYNINDLTKGINGFASQFPDTAYSTTLDASTNTTVAVPTFASIGTAQNIANRWLAIFHYEAAVNVYVDVNATAIVPAGNTFGATTSVLNPSGKIVKAGDTINVISASAATDVSIEFFAIQEG